MRVELPWSGRDINRVVAISGRAAMPNLPGGAGFNWRSMVGTTGWLDNRGGVSGLGRMVYRRMPARRGFGALGQDSTLTLNYPGVTDSGGTTFGTSPITGNTTENLSLYPTLAGVNTSGAAVTSQGANTGAPWYASLIGSALTTGSQIASYELNPIYQKQTVYTTPQGTIYASNLPTSSIPGLTTGTGTVSVMPILIGGGLLVILMMFMRK